MIRPCSSVHVGLSMVAAGLGVALGSAYLQRLQWQGVVYRQISPTSTIDFFLVRHQQEPAPSLPAFRQLARKVSAQFSPSLKEKPGA